MLTDGALAASVVKTHVVIKSSLKQAVRWQLLATNPADGVSPPTVRRPTLQIPTAEEMRTLMNAAAEPDYAIPVLLAATTGARRGEIVRLVWADVDLDAARLTIVVGKTEMARRTIDIPASTVTALRAHRKAQAERRLLCGQAWQDLGLVVDRGDGGPVNPDSLSHAFADIAESVGLPKSGCTTCDTASRRRVSALTCRSRSCPRPWGTRARASRPMSTSTSFPAWEGRRRTPSRRHSASEWDQLWDQFSSEGAGRLRTVR
jgi:integrase